MDTIAKHKKKLRARYKRSAIASEVISSAKHLARLVLMSDELLHRHKKKILSEVLWLISEADGKYSTRFRSAEVVRLANQDPGSSTRIQHEHVFPRKGITERILKDVEHFLQHPAELDALLESTVACVVTADEHRDLDNSEEGWARYKSVIVLDMEPENPVPRSESRPNS